MHLTQDLPKIFLTTMNTKNGKVSGEALTKIFDLLVNSKLETNDLIFVKFCTFKLFLKNNLNPKQKLNILKLVYN